MKLPHPYTIENSAGIKIIVPEGYFLIPCKQLLLTYSVYLSVVRLSIGLSEFSKKILGGLLCPFMNAMRTYVQNVG